MELKSVHTLTSPDDTSRVRLVGEVIYDDKPGERERYWFDVPQRYAGFLSTSGNPWLVCLAPLAVTLGEPLRLCRAIDDVLREGVSELMHIWGCWFPQLHAVPIEADIIESPSVEVGSKAGAFFSGGVDSFFTVLRHDEGRAPGQRGTVQDLLCVWGFDIPLSNRGAFERVRSTMHSVANGFGKELIDVATNLRETRLNQADWSHHYHGSALASVGLALEKRYHTLLIASSTYSYNRFAAWGSHPLIDHLLSTRTTRMVHDGAGHSRLDKTRLIAESDSALQALRVCWRDHSDANCGKCSKCYRTMLELELVGALSRCGTFPSKTLDFSQVRNLYVQGKEYRVLFEDIRSYAETVGRNDVADAIGRSLRNSVRIDNFLELTGRLAGKVIPWRAREAIKRRLLAGKIT